MKQISKAILSVMKEVKGMEKNSKIGVGNYAYDGTKDKDVKEVFNEQLAKNGLCILPTSILEETEVSRWEENGKQRQSVFTKVRTKYLLLHESGESIELSGYGHGVDAQDKGAGKATTYALKNCLLLSFLTPVGKIDDTDTTHSNEITSPKRAVEKKEKPWLNPGTDSWTKALSKNATLEEVKKHYSISKENEEAYKQELTK